LEGHAARSAQRVNNKRSIPVRPFITIVSGLPRSGTSMMMKMLVAGGMDALTDDERLADEDNPGGYFELQKVKEVGDDTSWLDDAKGRAVKMISRLLYSLPVGGGYKVIFMERNLSEVAASQRKMLERMGKEATEPDDVTIALYVKHLAEVRELLAARPDMDVLYVSYNDTMTDPLTTADAVNSFLGGGLDVVKMTSVLDNSLYRNRADGQAIAQPEATGPVSDEDDEAIKERLKSLGYL